jgi:uncharacterized membrane protein YjgN (DUF898 family)
VSKERKFPDPDDGPVDVRRVCIARDAPWDERSEQLADAIRLLQEKPAEAEAQIRARLEAGVNINARPREGRSILDLAEYYECSSAIKSMLLHASQNGEASMFDRQDDTYIVATPRAATSILNIEFHGRAVDYFRIWAVNLCLTLLTLGIFSAWAKVRKKRYFYSHTTLDGVPFQYLGQPWPILKGRLVAAALFLIWYFSSHFFVAIVPVVIALGVVLVPWVVVRSAAFNARYSQYRNMTFDFDGTTRRAALILYMWGMIPLLLVSGYALWQFNQNLALGLLGVAMMIFGFLFPFWLAWVKRFLVRHTRYGGVAGELSITGGNYYYIYFKAGLLAVLLMIPAVVVIGGLAKAFGGGMPAELQVFLGVAPVFLAYVFVYGYSQAQTGNLVWNNTRLGPVRFQSILTGRGLAALYLTNGLAILLSCGLLIPWAVVRTTRYRAEHLRGVMQGDWSVFQGSAARTVGAAGSEVGEMFDLDFSL